MITGNYVDYVDSKLPLNAVVIIFFCIADLLLFALIICITVHNYQKGRTSETNISKLEVESQNLRLLIDAAEAEKNATATGVGTGG